MKHNTIEVLDKGFIILEDVMGNDLAIVNAARVSFYGDSKGDEKDKKLLFYLMRNKHTTPFEMVEFKFHVKCPLFVARQWMRHRTWSYNEVSRRYTEINLDFYVPNTWRKQSISNKQGSDDSTIAKSFTGDLEEIIRRSVDVYERAIEAGVAREQARVFLPQAMYTEFIAKVDAHNLMHFLKLRMAAEAQYEIRVYANAIYKYFFKPVLPWTAEAFEMYNDLNVSDID